MFPTVRALAAHRIGRRVRWAAAAACLLLAATSAIGSSGAAAPRTSRGTATVVAARDLSVGHRLRPADLRTVRLAPAARPAGAIDDRDAYVGQRLAAPVTAREPLVAPRLLGRGLTTGLAAGAVAVVVGLDADVTGFVRAGDRVDLVATPGADDGVDRPAATPPTPTPRIVAPAVRVLAVPLRSAADDSGTRLVLAVTHRQALVITAARVSDVFTVVARAP